MVGLLGGIVSVTERGRATRAAVWVVAGALSATACGGDDGSTVGGEGGPGAETASVCTDLGELIDGVATLAIVTTDASSLPDHVEALAATADRVGASAPDELAAELQPVLDAVSGLHEALASADPADPADPEALAETVRTRLGRLGGDPETPAITDFTTRECGFDPTERANAALGDALDCVVEPGVVADVIGQEISTVELDGGALASASVEGSLIPEGDLDVEGVGLGWAGCEYLAADRSEVAVAELVGADGEPDTAGFDQIAALAQVPDTSRTATVGNEAFFDDDGALVVRAGDETLVLAVEGASLEEPDFALLEGVARELLAMAASDTPARCQELPGLVPSAWGEPGTLQQGGGTEHGHDFTSCSVGLSVVDGARLGVKLAPGTGLYDELATDAAGIAGDRPEPVAGIGDAAFRFGDRQRLFLRVGDHAYVVRVSGPDGDPGDPAATEALATAVAETAEAAG